MKKLIPIFFFLTLISASLVLAQDLPFPCSFYGTITVNGGNNNFSFDSVKAYLNNGTLADFSYPNPSISIGSYYINVNNLNSEIFLKINGVSVDQGAQTCTSGLIPLNLTANLTNITGSFNDTKQSNINNLSFVIGDGSVKFNQGNQKVVEFNLSSGSTLNLSNIQITKQASGATAGSIEISGISLPAGQTKTAYVDKIANENYVCILDQENANVSQMTGDCSGANEFPVFCDGTTQNGYTCTDLGDGTLKITGLTHSAVQQSSYSPPAPAAGGGGGGGGGGGAALVTTGTYYGYDPVLNTCSPVTETSSQAAANGDYSNLADCQAKIIVTPTTNLTENQTNVTQTGGAPITGGIIGTLGTGGIIAIIVLILIVIAAVLVTGKRKNKPLAYKPK